MAMAHRKPARMRLPPGYAKLKDNLGQIIHAHRLAGTGTDAPLPPKVFADRAGISRVALSRIEHDRAWPRSETLVAIMDIFEIDWPDVAGPGVTCSSPRRMPDTLQDMQRDTLCRALRAGRLALGWSLTDLASHNGLSASQLSRIERGQGGKSAVFGWHRDYLAIELQDRVIVFTHPVLANVAGGRGSTYPSQSSEMNDTLPHEPV